MFNVQIFIEPTQSVGRASVSPLYTDFKYANMQGCANRRRVSVVDRQDKMIHAECRSGKRNSSTLRHSCCYVVRIHRPTQFDSGHNAGIEKKEKRAGTGSGL